VGNHKTGYTLKFKLPEGPQGPEGPPAPIVGALAERIPSSADPEASVSGTPESGYTLKFKIPEGPVGPAGPPPKFSKIVAESALANSDPSVTFTETSAGEYDLTFYIPKGSTGAPGKNGSNGVTFIPKVTDGILSWTKLVDLDNPESIKTPASVKVSGVAGPAGKDGKTYIPKVSSEGKLSWLLDGVPVKDIEAVNLTGPAGKPGDKGEPGDPGASAGFADPEVSLSMEPHGTQASATIVASGPDTSKKFHLYLNLPEAKDGEIKGLKLSATEVDNTVTVPDDTVPVALELDGRVYSVDSMIHDEENKTFILSTESFRAEGNIPEGPREWSVWCAGGPEGPQGDPGFIQFEELTPEQKNQLKGDPGITPTITNVLVTTIEYGGDPYAEISGTPEYGYTLSLFLPGGKPGKQGLEGDPGEPGYTYIPKVSDDGILTWQIDQISGGPPSVAEADIRGPKGTVYTPTVDADGELTWSNPDGLDNPEPVNIRGPVGSPPSIVSIDAYPTNGMPTADITGSPEDGYSISLGLPKGDKGDIPELSASVVGRTLDNKSISVEAVENPYGYNLEFVLPAVCYYYPTVDEDTGELTWELTSDNEGDQTNPDPVNIKGPEGKQGFTFTPKVEDGILSWTNDSEGLLEDPEPVDIRGPKGDKGDKGDNALSVATPIMVTLHPDEPGYADVDIDENGVVQFTFGVPKGDPLKINSMSAITVEGDPTAYAYGDPFTGYDIEIGVPRGEKGDKPVKGTDYWTAADIEEIKAYCINAIETEEW
jgi:hypothetical protein